MTRALELAWRGWGRVQPNPLVGAVVLREGELVGEGWHAEFGERHAEAVALAAAGSGLAARRSSCTLEPCNHQGKQPPAPRRCSAPACGGSSRRSRDPNPVAAGGADRLRAAGVDVELGLLADEAAAQNAIFLHRQRDPSRPFVALKLATSIDGRIADANGHSRWLSGAAARDFVQWLRAGFDAIGGRRRHRAGRRSRRSRCGARCSRAMPPRRVVFAADGDVPAVAHAGPHAPARLPTIVVVGARRAGERVDAARGRGRRRDSCRRRLAEALSALRAAGVGSMLVEGGGRLAGALLAAGLVDRYYWVQTPLWLGAAACPAVAGLPTTAARRGARAGA